MRSKVLSAGGPDGSRRVDRDGGSGYIVQDPRRSGDLRLLEAIAEENATTGRDLAAMAADVFEVRRSLLGRVLDRLAASPHPVDRTGIAQATDALSRAVESGTRPAPLAAAERAVVDALLAAAGSDALALALNPAMDALERIEPICRARYADPEPVVLCWRLVVGWLRDPRSEGVARIDAELARADAAAVHRIRR